METHIPRGPEGQRLPFALVHYTLVESSENKGASHRPVASEGHPEAAARGASLRVEVLSVHCRLADTFPPAKCLSLHFHIHSAQKHINNVKPSSRKVALVSHLCSCQHRTCSDHRCQAFQGALTLVFPMASPSGNTSSRP